METLTYQQLITNIIKNYADKHPQNSPIETQIICDTQNHHYLLLYIGQHLEPS
ncbi:element excision factor XisI family protein [Crocosphaera sp. XPORK-15E]|uniref:element excision factor XisI family protein n=1 Tax=Crocosphaera sp. XPORK-15E TaxID=3110247 RepID=UPI002B20BEC6|nr:element excision factor XisI family protein [Crocosphaera sp. XPORK-15E]MEA5536700.1 element excision factor XisI family protein [Crocosphaera sp. XPORK-15E]